MKQELIILKLGGSVITKKDEERAEVNEEILDRLSREISEAKKEGKFRLLIVHGAGPFGHVLAKKYELTQGLKGKRQLKGFSITHQSMEKLNFHVVMKLREYGLNAIAYQPSAVGILRNKRLEFFPTRVIEKLLDLDMIPVGYGDVLLDEDSGIGILSGDHLVPYLAEKLKAERVIIATDVEGIFDSDPKVNRNAKLIKEVHSGDKELINRIEISPSGNTDVTGGMSGKLHELLNLAEKGINSEIISALEPDLLKSSLLGRKGLGTIIKKSK